MFAIEIPFFNLTQTFHSDQNLRWLKTAENEFFIVHKNKVNLVKQIKNNFIMSCTQEEFFKIWYEYFDVGTDYSFLNRRLKKISKELRPLFHKTNGVRIIKKDSYELLIESILRGNRYDLRQFCRLVGELHKGSTKPAWNELPPLERLRELDIELLALPNFKDETYVQIKSLSEDIRNGWINFEENLEGDDFSFLDDKQKRFYNLYSNIEDSILKTKGLNQATESLFNLTLSEFEDFYLNDTKGVPGLLLSHCILSSYNLKIIEERNKEFKLERLKNGNY